MERPAYRQQFEGGITVANVGDEPITVELDGLYRDLEGTLRTEVSLRPHAGELLVLVSAGLGAMSGPDVPASP